MKMIVDTNVKDKVIGKNAHIKRKNKLKLRKFFGKDPSKIIIIPKDSNNA